MLKNNLLGAAVLTNLTRGGWWNNAQRRTRSKYGGKVAPVQRVIKRRYISERECIINSMTNWQRNQAGKACKGRWSKLSVEKADKFANMPHWKEQRV